MLEPHDRSGGLVTRALDAQHQHDARVSTSCLRWYARRVRDTSSLGCPHQDELCYIAPTAGALRTASPELASTRAAFHSSNRPHDGSCKNTGQAVRAYKSIVSAGTCKPGGQAELSAAGDPAKATTICCR